MKPVLLLDMDPRQIALFWLNARRLPDSGCWETTYTCKSGRTGMHRKSPWGIAHRVAYQLCNGPIVEGMQINHICNNPLCVNPDHLEQGTQAENQAHMVKSGRSAKGSKHGMAKLTEAQVKEIKWLLHWGHGGTEIAKEFGCSKDTVSNIKQGRQWKHVTR